MDESSQRPPVDVPPAYEVVLDHLRREIQLGHYMPGQKFPPERAHAERLGVSRVTLREAIRTLEGEGYIETRRGSTGGAIILERVEPIDQLRHRLRWSIDELQAISDFRVANERCAAERAAARITKTQLRNLERTIKSLESSRSIGEFRLADSQFHLGIADAAQSDMVRRAVEDGRAAMFSAFDALQFELLKPSSLRAHRRILEALRNDDGAKAGKEMTAHLRTTWKDLTKVLGVDSSPSGG